MKKKSPLFDIHVTAKIRIPRFQVMRPSSNSRKPNPVKFAHYMTNKQTKDNKVKNTTKSDTPISCPTDDKKHAQRPALAKKFSGYSKKLTANVATTMPTRTELISSKALELVKYIPEPSPAANRVDASQWGLPDALPMTSPALEMSDRRGRPDLLHLKFLAILPIDCTKSHNQ